MALIFWVCLTLGLTDTLLGLVFANTEALVLGLLMLGIDVALVYRGRVKNRKQGNKN